MTINQTCTEIRRLCPRLTVAYKPVTKEYRITSKQGTAKQKEDRAYYTNDSRDAIATAINMNAIMIDSYENKYGELE